MQASTFVALHVLFVSLCAGHSLRTINVNAAESLGDAVNNIDRQYASRFNQGGSGEVSAFAQSIAGEFNSQHQVLVNPDVSRVVAEGNILAALKRINDNDVCSRNFKATCPSGWLHIGRFNCEAPASYTGGCQRMQSFEEYSLIAKLKFADDCDAQWPCQDDCAIGRNFDVCPREWTDVGDGYCSVPEATKCLASYKFNEMSKAQKEELASVCGFEWPCREACEQNYNAFCPQGWTSVNDICTGPRTYAGECGFTLNTHGMNVPQKQALAESCGVTFPCVS